MQHTTNRCRLLQVACLEALDAGAPAAAKQALLKLLEMVAAGDSEQYGPGYEAHIFQNLIKLIQVGRGRRLRGRVLLRCKSPSLALA